VKWIIVGGLCLLICGCQSISTGAIREQSALVDASTSRTLAEVATCLTSAPNLEELRGGGSMKILSFPDSKVMEFAIGAIQMGTFKSFYLVTLRDIGKGRINL